MHSLVLLSSDKKSPKCNLSKKYYKDAQSHARMKGTVQPRMCCRKGISISKQTIRRLIWFTSCYFHAASMASMAVFKEIQRLPRTVVHPELCGRYRAQRGLPSLEYKGTRWHFTCDSDSAFYHNTAEHRAPLGDTASRFKNVKCWHQNLGPIIFRRTLISRTYISNICVNIIMY